MDNNSFEDFLGALRAFESGWDRGRYDAGVIADWQLDQWAGGTVTDFFPQYASWGDLTDAEWDAMSYQSMNSLGFVGYQFGEALLIDLGYYDDDFFYGNGAATNTWDGTWTGKNGATSLEAFMTAAVQDQAILDAFGYNLQVIESGLANAGQSLDDFIGATGSYVQNGLTVTVELSLTGILAAAHLSGAWGTLALLQGGAVSTDEYGTSILQYIEQFGGYDAPSVDALIAGWEDGKTGDEGLGGPTAPPGDGYGDGSGNPDSGSPPSAGGSLGSAGVTAATATVTIDWAWGTAQVIEDFDPQDDTIFLAWIGANDLEVADTEQGVVFSVPSNNQSTTLAGVSLADLTAANFTFLDQSAADEVLALVGGDNDPGDGDGGTDHGGHQMVMISLTTPSQTVQNFNPAMDMIHIEAGVTAERLAVFEESGQAGLQLRLVVTDVDGTALSTTILNDIGFDDLTLANFSIAEESALNEVAAAIGSAIADPGGDGFDLTYDTDGSSPPTVTGATEAGGVSYLADPNADDIVGFNPASDAIDFGSASVHGLIVTKSPANELVLDSPWSEAAQIVQGVTFQALSVDSFGVVGNEHLRQDLGGVLSWEQNVGPRDPGTTYIRSHEYGASEVIDDFNLATDKISFLYFGTRERLSVEDTPDGLVISSLPTGQSFTFTGVTLADLAPGQVEFHFDQVMEDNLETPFGFSQDEVTLVARTQLLTPNAPAGETTDGHQVRDGLFPDDNGDGGGSVNPDPGDNGGGGPTSSDPDVVALTWNWGAQETIEGFDPATDQIHFGSLGPDHFQIDESTAGDLVIEIVGNGGQTYQFAGVGAEDILPQSLDAPDWNSAALAAAQDDLAALI
ncbi:MAG: hypothetical protein ROR55_17270 [Devosia sp.]